MKEMELFQNLLEKYKFFKKTSEDVQPLSIESGKDNLKIILKKTGSYSITFAVSMSLFFWLRKLGIHATIVQSKVIALVVTINLVASTVVGGTYIAKKVVSKNRETEKVEEQKIIENKKVFTTNKIADRKNKKVTTIKYDFGIKFFSGSNKSDAGMVTREILSRMKKTLGTKRVGMISQKRKFSVSKIILGSVRKVGKNSNITVKIIDVVSSRVEYLTTVEVIDNNYENPLNRITKKLVERLNKL